MKKIFVFSLALLMNISIIGFTDATPIAFYDEASYLTALSGYGYNLITEGFEGSIWNSSRYPADTTSITSQGLTWTASNPANTVNTGFGFARTESNGVFDGSGEPGMLEITSPGLLYGVGGWFNISNAEEVSFKFSIDINSEPLSTVYPLGWPEPHLFMGIVDTDGFSSINILTSSGHWGADDFTFAVSAPVPEPATILLLGSGLIGFAVKRKRKRSS